MKIPSLILALFIIVFFLSLQPQKIYAQNLCVAAYGNFCLTTPFPDDLPAGSINGYPMRFDGSNLSAGDRFVLLFRNAGVTTSPISLGESTAVMTGDSTGYVEFQVTNSQVLNEPGQKTIQIARLAADGRRGERHTIGAYEVLQESLSCSFSHTQHADNQQCIDSKAPLQISLAVIDQDANPYTGNLRHTLVLPGQSIAQTTPVTTNQQGQAIFSYSASTLENFEGQSAVIKVVRRNPNPISSGVDFLTVCDLNLPGPVVDQCSETALEEGLGNTVGGAEYEICNQIPPSSQLKATCLGCVDNDGGIWTAIGCIRATPESMLSRFIQLGIGLGGGISLLTVVASGFILTTSQGDPQRANQAKEMMTAAVVGLLFIIFSVVILQFIGVTVLKIPGFGEV